ncbi:type II secretion system F family protein [Nocardioides taihuensis]|uniref:Type II secretion system F family protein n=1 Tax=Nocardioides taihuensis TaxID=1835606 RepID=A0ABW0BH82_9ACTN
MTGVRAAALVAGAAAALAVLLLARPAPSWVRRRARPAAGVPTVTGVVAVVVGAGLVAPGSAALVAVVATAGVAGLGLLRRRARRRQAVAASARVLESCELLAAELAAGRPPGAALADAARQWPVLEPAAETLGLGGDVAGALRRLAAEPGAGDLRLVAAAWAVAHRTGAGLADALGACATGLRQARATRRVVEGELASARATARLIAGLPLLAMAMGAGSGGDPLAFLLGTPPGLVCLAGGLALGLAGLTWIERIAADVEAT